MTAPVLAPPRELPHDEDAGVHVALLCKWNEPVTSTHELGGRRYRRGEIKPPRSEAFVDVDHRHRDRAGRVLKCIADDYGLWASLELDERGRALYADGVRLVSLEHDGKGYVTSVALIDLGGTPGMPSARLFTRTHRVSGGSLVERGGLGGLGFILGGTFIVWGGRNVPPPPVVATVNPDMAAERAELYALSPAADEAEERRLRAAFERDRAQAAKDAAHAERVRRLRLDTCDPLPDYEALAAVEKSHAAQTKAWLEQRERDEAKRKEWKRKQQEEQCRRIEAQAERNSRKPSTTREVIRRFRLSAGASAQPPRSIPQPARFTAVSPARKGMRIISPRRRRGSNDPLRW